MIAAIMRGALLRVRGILLQEAPLVRSFPGRRREAGLVRELRSRPRLRRRLGPAGDNSFSITVTENQVPDSPANRAKHRIIG
jgi:hypothetical protein